MSKREKGAKYTRQSLRVRDGANTVIGQAEIEIGTDGTKYVYLRQTYGGSKDGTLSVPVKCDVEVLRAVVAEADEMAGG